MPYTRCPMRHIRDILRFTFDTKLSVRATGRGLKISRNTVRSTLERALKAGLAWPLPPDLSDADLEQKLFPITLLAIPRPLPDWSYVHQELQAYRQHNLTIAQLWEEYREQHPTGFLYSAFCLKYHAWRQTLDLVMRQSHKAGEKLFVDYTDGLGITDPLTGEHRSTELFVAVWGASCFTFAEATWSQKIPDWIQSHVHAFNYFGVVPRLLIPDNLKSGVLKTSRFDPTINPSYQDLAAHYNVTVLPARPYKPRDKAKVENGVLIAQRWILSVLRHRVFYSLAELNAAIAVLLEKLNNRLLRKLKKSRHQVFQELDRPAAQALPAQPYEFAQWSKQGVDLDYHINVEHHDYSVPCLLVGQSVDIKITPTTIEILHRGHRVAAHQRSYVVGDKTTLRDHMPLAHQKFIDRSPTLFLKRAALIGPHSTQFIQNFFDRGAHIEQAYRWSTGLLSLAKSVGSDRLESAVKRAELFRLHSLHDVRHILDSGSDSLPLVQVTALVLPRHDNIRGADYYSSEAPQ